MTAHILSEWWSPPTLPFAGIGWRSAHYQDLLRDRPPLGFIEIHPENYFGGGPHRQALLAAAEHYPVSIHAVGLSLGSADGLDRQHLDRLAALVAEINPCLVSDHLSWSRIGDAYYNDLIPLPLTEEALTLVTAHIDQVQQRLGRAILVENPSRYLTFVADCIPETDFLLRLCDATGCGLLVDINNIHVSASNLGFSRTRYLDAIPAELVGEIHLAGHTVRQVGDVPVLIDSHNAPVIPEVWQLFERAIHRFGPKPTLIEWDADLPAFDVLLAEARQANDIIEHQHGINA